MWLGVYYKGSARPDAWHRVTEEAGARLEGVLPLNEGPAVDFRLSSPGAFLFACDCARAKIEEVEAFELADSPGDG